MDRSASVEKPTKRIRRGHHKEIFNTVSRIAEVVLISFFLLSYHSSVISTSMELSGEILRMLLCLSSKPLPVFFVSNVIILAVAVLSGVDCGWKNGRRGGVEDDIYEEYITRRRVISAGGNSPEASLGPEDEKRIVLYSASGVSIDGGKGSWTTAAGTDGRAKNGPPRRERKAEKSADLPSSRRKKRLALPRAVREHALESPAAIVVSTSTAGQEVMQKSLSDASIDGVNDSSIVGASVGDSAAKSVPRQRAKEAEEPADVPSPRGRGRVVVVKDDGINTVEDMSNEEFNQSVEKYIAKTRMFLREESKREVDYPWIEHRKSF